MLLLPGFAFFSQSSSAPGACSVPRSLITEPNSIQYKTKEHRMDPFYSLARWGRRWLDVSIISLVFFIFVYFFSIYCLWRKMNILWYVRPLELYQTNVYVHLMNRQMYSTIAIKHKCVDSADRIVRDALTPFWTLQLPQGSSGSVL